MLLGYRMKRNFARLTDGDAGDVGVSRQNSKDSSLFSMGEELLREQQKPASSEKTINSYVNYPSAKAKGLQTPGGG